MPQKTHARSPERTNGQCPPLSVSRSAYRMSGVIAKVLADLGRLENPETPAVLSILVLEDLAMAVNLPLVAVLLAGGGATRMALAVSLAISTVFLVLLVVIRYGQRLSRFAAHESDEIVLLTTLGVVLLVAGISEQVRVSAGIGAFLVGIAVSGPMAEQTHRTRAASRPVRRNVLFFLWASDRSGDPTPGAAIRRLVGWRHHRDKGTDRLLGCSTTGSGPTRTTAGRDGPGGARRVLDCNCGLRLCSRTSTWTACSCLVLFLAVLSPILARAAK